MKSPFLTGIKRLLKTRGLKYEDVATELGMSLSGVKKLLSGTDISIDRLSKIGDIMGLSLSEVVLYCESPHIEEVTLSERQEQSLIKNKILFRVYWRLGFEHLSQEAVMKMEKLTLKEWNSLIRKLENLDLVVSTSTGIRLMHPGLVRWSNEGALVKELNRDWSHVTLEKSLRKRGARDYHRLAYLQLSQESADAFQRRLNDLFDEFSFQAQKDRVSSVKCEPQSVLVALSGSGFLDSDAI